MAGWTKILWNTKFAYQLHMISTGNQTPDLLITSPMQYPLDYIFVQVEDDRDTIFFFFFFLIISFFVLIYPYTKCGILL